MLTKIHHIKTNIWKQINFNTFKKGFVCVKKEENVVKSQKVIFQTSQKIFTKASSMQAAYSEHSIHNVAIHSISLAGYVTAGLAFVCGELPTWEVSTFCDILEKLPLVISLHISPFWLK